jgi:hypothetical protein
MSECWIIKSPPELEGQTVNGVSLLDARANVRAIIMKMSLAPAKRIKMLNLIGIQNMEPAHPSKAVLQAERDAIKRGSLVVGVDLGKDGDHGVVMIGHKSSNGLLVIDDVAATKRPAARAARRGLRADCRATSGPYHEGDLALIHKQIRTVDLTREKRTPIPPNKWGMRELPATSSSVGFGSSTKGPVLIKDHNYTPEDGGRKFRDERVSHGISLIAAARKLGLSVSEVSGIEVGRYAVDDWDKIIEAMKEGQ